MAFQQGSNFCSAEISTANAFCEMDLWLIGCAIRIDAAPGVIGSEGGIEGLMADDAAMVIGGEGVAQFLDSGAEGAEEVAAMCIAAQHFRVLPFAS